MLRKLLYALACTVLLAGCAGAGSSQAATEITVEAIEFAYNPLAITIPAGELVTLLLKNSGQLEHDFVIDKINVSDVHASDVGPAAHHQMGHEAQYDLHFYAKAGDTAVLNFTALEAGTYEFFCSIEGHKEAGMIGQLIVAPQD